MGGIKKVGKAVTKAVKSTVGGGLINTILNPKVPDVNIPGPDPAQIAAANLQNNLSQDLGLENIPTVEVGGNDISEAVAKKRRNGGGVASSLGII